MQIQMICASPASNQYGRIIFPGPQKPTSISGKHLTLDPYRETSIQQPNQPHTNQKQWQITPFEKTKFSYQHKQLVYYI